MMAWLRRAFKQRPTDKPAPLSGGDWEISVGAGAEGNAAGVVMPDGSIVRCPGEPPTAPYKGWWPPIHGG